MPLPWLERTRSLRWPAVVLVFLGAVALTMLVAHTGPAVRVRAGDGHPPDALPPGGFQESVVAAQPPGINPEGPSVVPPPCECFGNALKSDAPAYFLNAFGGGSYFDTPGDTSAGGMYGAQLTVPITGNLYAAADGMINHYSGGTQVGGSVGFGVAPGFDSNPLGRFGWSVFVDQATDSQYEDPWLVQGRYAVGYQLTRGLAIGAQYTDPYHGEDVPSQSVVPTAIGGTLPFRPVEVVEATATFATAANMYLQVGFGYIDAFETTTYSAAGSYPITDQVAATFNGTYDEKIGLWTGFFGVSVDLSPRRRESWATARLGGSSDVVRGELFFTIPSAPNRSDYPDEASYAAALADWEDTYTGFDSVGSSAVIGGFFGLASPSSGRRTITRTPAPAQTMIVRSQANASQAVVVQPLAICNCPAGFTAIGGQCVNDIDPFIVIPCL